MKKLTIVTVSILTAFLAAGCIADRHVKTLYSNDPQQTASDKTIKWVQVAPGLASSDLLIPYQENDQKEILLVSIDPKLFRFKIYINKEESRAKSIEEIQQEQHSLLTFNGSFFDEKFKALGLLISEKKILQKPLVSKLLNGIFGINENDEPVLINTTDLKAPIPFYFAVQNGPILIDNEGTIKIETDTGKTASRTAIGLDKDGHIIVITMQQSILNSSNALSLYQFAHLLKESPLLAGLELHSMLNLDGGPSTGIMVGGQYFPEINDVQNVITVFSKS